MPGRPKREDSRHAQASRRLARDLKTARVERKMTQQALATEAGISIGTVRKVEDNEVVEPGLFTVLAIARALDYDIEHFFRSWQRD